jgi:hypothetical protein
MLDRTDVLIVPSSNKLFTPFDFLLTLDLLTLDVPSQRESDLGTPRSVGLPRFFVKSAGELGINPGVDVPALLGFRSHAYDVSARPARLLQR